jgi:hypothetical protein
MLQGPLLNASYFGMAQQADVSLTKLVLASGYNLLAAGCSGPFGKALYGHRIHQWYGLLTCP